jgi:hypothetical protein
LTYQSNITHLSALKNLMIFNALGVRLQKLSNIRIAGHRIGGQKFIISSFYLLRFAWYVQQRDRLVLTVKYSQRNLCSMLKLIRLRIYWWSLTVLYSVTCCWLYVMPLVSAAFAVVSAQQYAPGPRGGLWPVLFMTSS